MFALFLLRYTKLKTATNIYIFNLALADALATSTLPFQSAKYLMETWPFGELLCKAVLSIDYYNMFTSIFTLTMMSVDRYIAVCHPVKALDFRTPAKAKLINICIWVLASGVGVPIMVMAVTQPRGECQRKLPHGSQPDHLLASVDFQVGVATSAVWVTEQWMEWIGWWGGESANRECG